MIGITAVAVTGFDIGAMVGSGLNRAGQEGVMAPHPGSAMPPSRWHSPVDAYTHGQLSSFIRAAVIALVLLGILALIVLL